jgi:hypothetical protein
MAYEIQNIPRNKSIVRMVGADSATLTMNSFSTNTTTETVTSVKITQVKWSADPTGNVNIGRGTNTVLSLYNTGDWNLAASGLLVANSSASNVVVSITGDGTCILECVKESTFTPALG